jgi:hypothetical protein
MSNPIYRAEVVDKEVRPLLNGGRAFFCRVVVYRDDEVAEQLAYQCAFGSPSVTTESIQQRLDAIKQEIITRLSTEAAFDLSAII